VLKKYLFEKLVIVGDLSEGSPIGSLQVKLVKKLKKLHQEERLVVLFGNHDPKGNGVCEKIGIEAIGEYRCQINGKNFCAKHGDEFNDLGDSLSGHVIDWLICKFMVLIKLIELKGINLGRIFIQLCAQLNALEVTRKAKEFAIQNECDTMICGHVHVPCHRIFRVRKGKKRIDYFNCGCFMDDVCTYLLTDECGRTRLHSVTK